ncbi:MAG: DNA primase [Burkholderiales bacterium]|nr:DNA primase [Burkholderiales bacterium]
MNWGNYDDVLRQLREAGLQVDDLVIGQRQRCRVEGADREKRGWYRLHELRLDSGDYVIVGSYGIWRGADPGSTKIELGKGTPMSAEQRLALRARLAEDRKQEQAARRAEAGRAAVRAQAMWARLATDGDSDYLRRKCIQSHGLRFSESGTMVVPLLDAGGQIHGLQLIFPSGHPRRKRLGRDKDFWPKGVAKQGHHFALGSPPAGACCLLAEGYATAATLYEATGLPTVVAFDAGNLVHVAEQLRKRHRGLRLLVCADDDYLGKCRACGKLTLTGQAQCLHCGAEHGAGNAGVNGAHTAALAVDGAVAVPTFAAERPTDEKGPTDWNDLHVREGLHVVRAQIEARLTALGWRGRPQAAPTHPSRGEGGAGAELTSINTLYELHERYVLVYEASDMVFDAQEHVLVPLASMRNLCTSKQLHRNWLESLDKRVVRLREVGFDPTERDDTIKCNLWGGWPTQPRAGRCDRLLELGEYLCSEDPKAAEMWRWLQCWLAYPVQHPGAKMKTAVIMHGPQGTGKNVFFEAVLRIYGEYGAIVDQDAIEDKHNDFMSRKLMLVADEVVARQEMYHSKNKLKGLVTSDWIRINPKHLASYRERNHVQIVFLSNEVQPMALERDDRRYAVIWTPQKWSATRYHDILQELDAGGIAALHQHLLSLDLGDFGPATLPPMTDAKRDLVELGLDSSERFFNEWAAGYLPIPRRTCRSEDLYAAYRHWCTGQGVGKPAQLSTFIGTLSKRPGVQKGRHQHYKNQSRTVLMQSVLITPPDVARPDGAQALADSINAFAEALKTWKDESAVLGGGSSNSARGAKVGNGRPVPPETDDDAPY